MAKSPLKKIVRLAVTFGCLGLIVVLGLTAVNVKDQTIEPAVEKVLDKTIVVLPSFIQGFTYLLENSELIVGDKLPPDADRTCWDSECDRETFLNKTKEIEKNFELSRANAARADQLLNFGGATSPVVVDTKKAFKIVWPLIQLMETKFFQLHVWLNREEYDQVAKTVVLINNFSKSFLEYPNPLLVNLVATSFLERTRKFIVFAKGQKPGFISHLTPTLLASYEIRVDEAAILERIKQAELQVAASYSEEINENNYRELLGSESLPVPGWAFSLFFHKNATLNEYSRHLDLLALGQQAEFPWFSYMYNPVGKTLIRAAKVQLSDQFRKLRLRLEQLRAPI